MIAFEVSASFPVSGKQLFEAWLDSEKHSNMTGGDDECSDKVGGEFSAWDGYISGVNVSIDELNGVIVQKWRTSEFEESDDYSLLTLRSSDIHNGGEIHLTHENIPEGQSDYQQGWIEHYFEPMKTYFSQG